MAEIKAVLFDLDGTILDTHDLILDSFRYTMREVLGKQFSDAELMQKVGQPLETQMWDFTNDPQVHEQLTAVYRAYNHAIHDERVRAFKGVPEALEALRAKGLPLAVVTSKKHALAQRGLEVLGLWQHFDLLVGPDDFPAHKPDPGPVRFGCQQLGLAPDECLYVGDSPFDMQAGNGAGCITVAVTWGMFPREVLEAENPAHVITEASELPQLIMVN